MEQSPPTETIIRNSPAAWRWRWRHYAPVNRLQHPWRLAYSLTETREHNFLQFGWLDYLPIIWNLLHFRMTDYPYCEFYTFLVTRREQTVFSASACWQTSLTSNWYSVCVHPCSVYLRVRHQNRPGSEMSPKWSQRKVYSNSQIKIHGLANNEQDTECDRRKEKWYSIDAEEEEWFFLKKMKRIEKSVGRKLM